MYYSPPRMCNDVAELLCPAGTICEERSVPEGARKVGAVFTAGACGPLPDDEALKDGAERLAAATAEHFNGIGGAEATRGRRGDDHLQLGARTGEHVTSWHVCFFMWIWTAWSRFA